MTDRSCEFTFSECDQLRRFAERLATDDPRISAKLRQAARRTGGKTVLPELLCACRRFQNKMSRAQNTVEQFFIFRLEQYLRKMDIHVNIVFGQAGK